MTTATLLAAVCSGAAFGTVSYRMARPRRRIAHQIAPYTVVARSHLGVDVESLPEPLVSGEVVRRVLGPLGSIVSRRLLQLLGLTDRQALELKLRQAGQPMTIEQYRRRHLQYAIGAPIVCGMIGWALGSTLLVVLFMVGGSFAGARRMPDRLRGMTRRRRERIRSDLPTIAWMLTPRIRNRMTVVVAIGALVEQGSGAVVEDLSRALALIGNGFSPSAAFDQITKESPEPAAARFYAVLGAATAGAIDLAPALLELARELRTHRREEIERSSAKRQMAMIIPDLAFMAPVLLMFLVAPIPRLLFGTS
ncbi:MAG TPA: type II secretion system F family protein [Acidimicrobiales bacterium]|jgi:tight adherence protein C|nr:type II secretion system F family protein [Acidimicrobiales bacterium]